MKNFLTFILSLCIFVDASAQRDLIFNSHAGLGVRDLVYEPINNLLITSTVGKDGLFHNLFYELSTGMVTENKSLQYIPVVSGNIMLLSASEPSGRHLVVCMYRVNRSKLELSLDFGHTWSTQMTLPAMYVRLEMMSPRVIYCIPTFGGGVHDELHRSNDGGRNWSRIFTVKQVVGYNTVDNFQLSHSYFMDISTGMTVVRREEHNPQGIQVYHTFYTTVDGGLTWSKKFTYQGRTLSSDIQAITTEEDGSISFIDNLYKVYTSYDGGITFRQSSTKYTPTFKKVNKVYAVDSTTYRPFIMHKIL